MNQTDFASGAGDTTGDKTDFDLADLGSTTRAYVGDASDDFVLDDDPKTPLPQVWRHDNIGSVAGSPTGSVHDTAAGWRLLSNERNGTRGFLAAGWCQNGQCNYDSFVDSPPGHPNTVWFGGSMNYDELLAYDQQGTGAPPRSNGRAVIRSTDAGAAPSQVGWQDMTAVIGDTAQPWDIKSGIHPDQHAIASRTAATSRSSARMAALSRVNVNPRTSRPRARTAHGTTTQMTRAPRPLAQAG